MPAFAPNPHTLFNEGLSWPVAVLPKQQGGRHIETTAVRSETYTLVGFLSNEISLRLHWASRIFSNLHVLFLFYNKQPHLTNTYGAPFMCQMLGTLGWKKYSTSVQLEGGGWHGTVQCDQCYGRIRLGVLWDTRWGWGGSHSA